MSDEALEGSVPRFLSTWLLPREKEARPPPRFQTGDWGVSSLRPHEAKWDISKAARVPRLVLGEGMPCDLPKWVPH